MSKWMYGYKRLKKENAVLRAEVEVLKMRLGATHAHDDGDER
tara:strand:+ start:75 stop:200 length:126 start_codon:yes stop_codon:yes gene_type:complete